MEYVFMCQTVSDFKYQFDFDRALDWLANNGVNYDFDHFLHSKRTNYNAIALYRVFFELTQTDLSRFVGISKNAISEIELCNYLPRLSTVFGIIEAFQIVAQKHNLSLYEHYDGYRYAVLEDLFPKNLHGFNVTE